MAKTTNILLDSMSGGLGKQIVVKQYSYGMVVTSYPDMTDIQPSREQALRRHLFKEAIAYAQRILRDPNRKKEYEKGLRKGETVYHKAIKEYLMLNKE